MYGTNFVGAEKDLSGTLAELNQDIIESALQRQGISWIFNPPAASHMGGAWKRLARNVLSGLLQEFGG